MVLSYSRVLRMGSSERGTYLGVCTSVFAFALFQGDPEGDLLEGV